MKARDMTDKERIAQLEARLAHLESRVAVLEASRHQTPVQPTPTFPALPSPYWQPYVGWTPGKPWCGAAGTAKYNPPELLGTLI